MKLNIKKIALILSASIFVLTGVVAQEKNRPGGDTRPHPSTVEMGKDHMFQKIKLENKNDEHKVKIVINEEQGNKVKLSGNGTENIKGNIKTIDIEVEKKGLFGPKEKEVKIDLSQERPLNKERAIAKIKEAVESELKNKGISIVAEEGADNTLVLTVQKVEKGEGGKAEEGEKGKEVY